MIFGSNIVKLVSFICLFVGTCARANSKTVEATASTVRHIDAKLTVDQDAMQLLTCDDAKAASESRALARCKSGAKQIISGVTYSKIERKEYYLQRPYWLVACTARATAVCKRAR
jgi:hypothetical protein